MKNKKFRYASMIIASLMLFSILPVSAFATTGSASYIFLGENPGGETPYIEYSSSTNEAEVWINGGKVTHSSGAIVNYKINQVYLFERENGKATNLTTAKNVVWGASKSLTPPSLVKGKFKDTSAKNMVKVSKGKLTAGKEQGLSYVHTYRTKKVKKDIQVQNLHSFPVLTKVAPAKIDPFGDVEFKKKLTKASIDIGGEVAVYFLPSAGTARSPLTVDESTRYKVEVTKYPTYVSLATSSSAPVEGEDPVKFSLDPKDNVSSLELSLAELKEGFYIRGIQSKSDTANGTATVTVTCLNNGKKKTFNTTVLKPPVETEAKTIEISYGENKKITFAPDKDSKTFGTIVSSAGSEVATGEELALNTYIEEKELQVGIGDEITTKIKAIPINNRASVTYSMVSGGTGSTVSGVYTVNMIRPTARVKVTIKHGTDNTSYFVNIISTSNKVTAAVPTAVSLLNNNVARASLTEEQLNALEKNPSLTATLEVGNVNNVDMNILLGGNLRIISAGTPKDNEVLVTVTSASAKANVGGVTSSGGNKAICNIEFDKTTSIPVVVTIQTTTAKTTLNLTLINNYYIDSKITRVYVGATKAADFIKYGSSDKVEEEDNDWGASGADYYTVATLSRTTASFTANQEIILVRNDSNSDFTFTYTDYKNISTNTETNKVTITTSASDKYAIFYITATPKNANAIDITTNVKAETKKYKVTVKWS